jgi:hypothetical protein
MSESNISFNSDYIDLVKNLSSISQSIVFNKKEDKIEIIRSNESQSIFYKVVAPQEYFTFNDNRICFRNFIEFYQFMSVCGVSTLQQKDNCIVINSSSGKIKYTLSDYKSLRKAPENLNIQEPDISFNISADNLTEIKKINSLIGSKFANISYKDGKVNVELSNTEFGNTFDKDFSSDFVKPGVDELNFSIYTEIFTKIPITENYKVILYKEKGPMIFTTSKNNVDISLFIGRTKKMES